MSLDFLGAEGLKDQYVVARVVNVDTEKLRKAIGAEGWRGALTSAAITLTDRLPKLTLDIGLPLAEVALKDHYGIDAKIFATEAPPGAAPRRSTSEFFPGFAIGAGVVGVSWAVLSLFRRIFV